MIISSVFGNHAVQAGLSSSAANANSYRHMSEGILKFKDYFHCVGKTAYANHKIPVFVFLRCDSSEQ